MKTTTLNEWINRKSNASPKMISSAYRFLATLSKEQPVKFVTYVDNAYASAYLG